MDEFDKEMKEVLEKHLPAKMFETVEKKIKQITGMEEQIKMLISQLRDEKKEKSELLHALAEREEFDAEVKEFEGTKSAFDKDVEDWIIKENNLKISLLEKDVQCANDKADFARDLALGLVRNTTFKRSVLGNRDVVQKTDEYNNPINAPTQSLMNSEDVEITEE